MSNNVPEASNPENKKASKLKIRLAKSKDDIEFLRPLSVEFHAESRFSDIPYSHKKRDELFSSALKHPDRYALMMAEYDGEPAGFLFCTIGEYIVGYEELITTVYSFYVSRKYRGTVVGGKSAIRLLAGSVKWSQMRKAREIMIHVTSGINVQRTDKFLRRAGFGTIGANYSLFLKDRAGKA